MNESPIDLMGKQYDDLVNEIEALTEKLESLEVYVKQIAETLHCEPSAIREAIASIRETYHKGWVVAEEKIKSLELEMDMWKERSKEAEQALHGNDDPEYLAYTQAAWDQECAAMDYIPWLKSRQK